MIDHDIAHDQIALADLKDTPEWSWLTEKQKIFILAYLRSWNTRKAASEAGVAVVTVYQRWQENERFAKVFEIAKRAFIAEMEDKLFEWIDEKKDARTLFEILKIRGRKYGWGESVEVNHNGKIVVEFVNADTVSEKDEDISPAGDNIDEAEERR